MYPIDTLIGEFFQTLLNVHLNSCIYGFLNHINMFIFIKKVVLSCSSKLNWNSVAILTTTIKLHEFWSK